jgi:hypothetical protein
MSGWRRVRAKVADTGHQERRDRTHASPAASGVVHSAGPARGGRQSARTGPEYETYATLSENMVPGKHFLSGLTPGNGVVVDPRFAFWADAIFFSCFQQREEERKPLGSAS